MPKKFMARFISTKKMKAHPSLDFISVLSSKSLKTKQDHRAIRKVTSFISSMRFRYRLEKGLSQR